MMQVRILPAIFAMAIFSLTKLTVAVEPTNPVDTDLIKQPVISGIGPTGPIKKLHTDFEFTEGPVAIGENVYFTDIPKQRLYKLDGDGKLSIFLEPTGLANGLFYHRGRNEIIVCEMKGCIVAVARKAYKVDATPQGKGKWSSSNLPLDQSHDGSDTSKPSVSPIAEQYNGNRFNAPNDLVIDRQGGIYFTDPQFRAPTPLPQEKACVYYVDPEGKVTRLIDDLKNPNGVILSPDEMTLYVIPSGSADMMAYPIEAPGKLGPGKMFCTLEQAKGKKDGGGDGLTIDAKGNLYITSRIGIQVFDPRGNLLGIIRSPELIPEQPSNCTFGGKDNKTLFITARKSVYSCPMEVPGHVFPAGKKD
jgi:gluconolactonase